MPNFRPSFFRRKYTLHRSMYPNVPCTKVVTWVWLCGIGLEAPKSDTFAVKFSSRRCKDACEEEQWQEKKTELHKVLDPYLAVSVRHSNSSTATASARHLIGLNSREAEPADLLQFRAVGRLIARSLVASDPARLAGARRSPIRREREREGGCWDGGRFHLRLRRRRWMMRQWARIIITLKGMRQFQTTLHNLSKWSTSVIRVIKLSPHISKRDTRDVITPEALILAIDG
uniref:Uncharacterized protein n=1 Tax=Oryza glumipatula TaxID=40148 RepID=A0A0D9ZQ49_9ORYZ